MKKVKNTKKLPVSIKIVGLILSESYQKCKILVQKLRKHYNEKFSEPEIKGYLDMDWVEYLAKLRKDIGGQTWAMRKGVVVFLDGVFLGGESELFTEFSLYVFEHPPQEKIASLAKEEYVNYLKQNNLLYTFFELSLDGQYMGSLLFELRPDLLPKTCVWFAMICDPHNHLGFSYQNSLIHRVCKSGWFQGGRLGLGASAGFLEDESFCYKHDRRGILSMNNYGKDTSRAQFFVTFKPSTWMDEYYVAFGRVVEGSDVLRRLENTKCTYEHPDHEIRVDKCGVVGFGFGKHLMTSKKMKGLTVGDPHIHLETFMDIVMQRFEEVLYERLSDEVKKELKGEWIGQMLWDAISPQLATREPIADVLDHKDKPSDIFHPSMFIKGLYGLKEIPDHYINELLNEIIDESVDMVDTREMACSIVNLIIDSLDLAGRQRDGFTVQSFVEDVHSIVYGAESKTTTVMTKDSKKELFQRSVYRVTSQTPTIRKLLATYSTYSLSRASSQAEEDQATTFIKNLFQQSAHKVESVPTVVKMLKEHKTVSFTQPVGAVEDKRGQADEVLPSASSSPGLARKSVSGMASHDSTVRKLMTDYTRFSMSSLKPSSAEDKTGVTGRPSTRDSIVGYIWETLLTSFNA